MASTQSRVSAGEPLHWSLDLESPMNSRSLGGGRCCCRVVKWLRETEAIAVGGDDGQIRLYRETGLELTFILIKNTYIKGVCENGRNTIISVGSDGYIRAWRIGYAARELHSTPSPDKKPCTTLEVQNRTSVFVGTEGGCLVLYEWKRDKLILACHKIHAHAKQIESIHCFDGLLAIASRDQHVSLWDPEKLIAYKYLAFSHFVYSVQVNKDYIAIGAKDFIRLHKNKHPDFQSHVDIRLSCGLVRHFSFLLDDVFLAVCEKGLSMISTKGEPQVLNSFKTPAKYIQNAAFLPTGEVAVCGVGRGGNSILQLSDEYTALIMKCMKTGNGLIGSREPRGNRSREPGRKLRSQGSPSSEENGTQLYSSGNCNKESHFPSLGRVNSSLMEWKNMQRSYNERQCEEHQDLARFHESIRNLGLIGHFDPSMLTLADEGYLKTWNEYKSTRIDEGNLLEHPIEKWINLGLTHEEARRLDFDDFAHFMASSIVGLPRWVKLYEPTLKCIRSALNANRSRSNDGHAVRGIEQGRLLQHIGQAMEDSVGIKMLGPLNRAKHFLNKYGRTIETHKCSA